MTASASPETTTRTGSPAGTKMLGLPFSIGFGALSFAVVSVVAYAPWAFKWVPAEKALFAVTAFVYLGLSGFALSRLVNAPEARKRFMLVFAAAFLIYAIAYSAFWFGLRIKYRDYYGSAVGLAAVTWLLQRALGKKDGFLHLFLVLLVLHSIGYYAGGELYRLARGATGRILYGVGHGLGFGAGLGYVIYFCQKPSRPKKPT